MNRMMRQLAIASLLLSALFPTLLSSQTKVGYVASQVIRDRYPEAQKANQRIDATVNEWKKELEEKQKAIDEMEMEIKKKRLIWSDIERREKEDALDKKKKEREEFAKRKFGPEGEFDSTVAKTYKPIEEKIFAAIQAVSNSEGYDIIWDKSTQPLVYVNPRYDITVKVMEKLEIPVEDLKEQQEKLIQEDPRNQKPQEKRKVDRSKSRSKDVEPEKPEPTPKKDVEIPRQ